MVIDHRGKISVNKIHWLCQPLLPYLLQAGHWHLAGTCGLVLESYRRLQRKCWKRVLGNSIRKKSEKKISKRPFSRAVRHILCSFSLKFWWLSCSILNLGRMLCGVPLNKETTFSFKPGLTVWLCCLGKMVNILLPTWCLALKYHPF